MYGGFNISEQASILAKGFGSATWADVNGDGLLDLLLNGDGGFTTGEDSNDVYRLYKNNDGVLEEAAIFNDYRQISVGDGSRFWDFDNDGDFDIVLTGWSGSKGRQVTMVFECTDAANFTYSEHAWSDAIPGVSESSIEVADLNNDGKTDLILTGYNGDQATQIGKYNRNIYGYVLNTTAVANTRPQAPTNLISSQVDGGIKLEWDAATDTETSANALTYQLCVKNKVTGKWLLGPNAFVGGVKDGQRKVTGMGNLSINNRWWLYELSGGTYEWSVQAIDAAYAGSEWGAFGEFTVEATAIKAQKKLSSGAHITMENHTLTIALLENMDQAKVKVFSITGQRIYAAPLVSDVSHISIDASIPACIVKVVNNNAVQIQKVINF
jgi:hypothetical protein